MSADNLVTPETHSANRDPVWIERLMSLATVRILRMRNIERVFGTSRRLADRCGCRNESRFPLPSEHARVWCGLSTHETRGRITQATQCRLMETGWFVWQPESAGFTWAEILEIDGISSFLFQSSDGCASSQRSLEEWEDLGRTELKFRVLSQEEANSGDWKQNMRVAVVSELLQRHPGFSHVNLSVSSPASDHLLTGDTAAFLSAGVAVERLRERYLPSWQCGDMAIQTVTTYTMSRKDVR